MGTGPITDINAIAAAYEGIGGLHYTRKFGYNADVDAAYEPIWNVGGALTYQTAAVAVEIISGSADDDGAPVGTGARTVKIFGLDGNYKPVSETVTMNGTTAVALENTYIFIYRAFVVTAGSGTVNAGLITIRKVAGPVTMASIAVGVSQTQTTYFQVPAGCKAIMSNLSVDTESIPNSSQLAMKVWVYNPVGGVKKLKKTASWPDTAGGYDRDEIVCTLNEKEIVYVEGYSSVANFAFDCSYDIFVYGPMGYASELDK